MRICKLHRLYTLRFTPFSLRNDQTTKITNIFHLRQKKRYFRLVKLAVSGLFRPFLADQK